MSRVKVRRPSWSPTTVTCPSLSSGSADAVGQSLHGLHEVVPLADDPGAAHDVVARAAGHGDVAGCLGLAVDGQRGEGLLPSCTSAVPSKT